MGGGGRAGCVPGSFHTHADGERAAFCVCRAHEENAAPPCLTLRAPPGTRGTAWGQHPRSRRGCTACPAGGRLQGQRIAHPCIPGGCPSTRLPGLRAPLRVRGAGGAGGAPPRSPPGTPQPRFALSRSAAWPPCSRSPFSSADREFSHHPLAEAGMSPRTAFPNAGIPRLPGTPGPPGIPFPSAGSSGVCTHPLPAAVALSLETGSDSGSITFSALSLSGNFCGNPSEIGG